jgi:AraC-like DNA-binding protein
VGQAQTGIPYLQVGVTLEPEQLRYFFKNERLLLPPFLQPILDRRPDEKVFQMGVATLEMLKTARELLNCRQHGLARKLFLESKALELLSYQMEYFATDDVGRQRPKDIHPEDRRKTEYAHDLLISNIANPPHLKELTKAAGMSHPKLNRCFKQLYGSTVFEYLRNQRLLRASEMLEQPGVTATEVAYTMGYSSPSHFSRAYKKQFGRLPKINPE